jgi:hypothetical protein
MGAIYFCRYCPHLFDRKEAKIIQKLAEVFFLKHPLTGSPRKTRRQDTLCEAQSCRIKSKYFAVDGCAIWLSPLAKNTIACYTEIVKWVGTTWPTLSLKGYLGAFRFLEGIGENHTHIFPLPRFYETFFPKSERPD